MTRLQWEHGRAWIAALRSGKYKQAHKKLRVADGSRYAYCCLGVACELNRKAGGGRWYKGSFKAGDEEQTEALTFSVQEWLGVREDEPYVHVNETLREPVTHMNDNLGWSFDKIADALEKDYYPVEFKEAVQS